MYKYCIAGKNNIAVNSLKYLIEVLNINKSEITVVINSTDTGKDSWQKSLKKYAIEVGITISNLEDVYNIEDLLFISLEFDKIIKTEKFATNRLYNIHFSNLPKYKGMYTSIIPILNGEKEAGVTLHCIDNGIDTGDIIDQKIFKISLDDTARDLYFKYLDNAFKLFKENITNLISEKYNTRKQLSIDSSYFSKKEIDFSNIKIDLNKTSFEIYNQIRAFIFPEYQLPVIKNYSIEHVYLTNDFIGYKKLLNNKTELILSGIDGYKIIAQIKN